MKDLKIDDSSAWVSQEEDVSVEGCPYQRV